MNVEQNYSLQGLNTFGVAAHAAYYAQVQFPADLAALLADPAVRDLPRLVLGGGSNILFLEDFPGLIIHSAIGGRRVLERDADTALVEAGGGVVWHDLVTFCLKHNLGGLENLSLIPGTVGASPVQNIGAYGVEIKDVFESLDALELATGAVRHFSKAECRFGYRDSIFKRELKGQYLILAARYRLTTRNHAMKTNYGAIDAELRRQGDAPVTIRRISEAVCRIRESKLPDPAQLGNAGSFFKNPVVPAAHYEALKGEYPGLVAYPAATGMKLAAGWLIDQCGWKGKRVGNVGAHAQQALVLVNYGGATGAEIYALARQIRDSVRDRFGVTLEMEVNLVGAPD